LNLICEGLLREVAASNLVGKDLQREETGVKMSGKFVPDCIEVVYKTVFIVKQREIVLEEGKETHCPESRNGRESHRSIKYFGGRGKVARKSIDSSGSQKSAGKQGARSRAKFGQALWGGTRRGGVSAKRPQGIYSVLSK